MIDIHAHILPGIDDGPGSLDDSLALLKAASEDGTRSIVATPHTLNGLYVNRRREILDKVDSLRTALEDKGIALSVLPGADVALTPELIPSLDAGEVTSINDNNRYILVELQPSFDAGKIFEIIFQLRTRGLTPLITHPERDDTLIRRPELLEEFIEKGCLLQITAGSITGGFGRTVKEFSRFILRHRLAHIIASDCHSIERRGPCLSKAVAAASQIVGSEMAGKMVNDFPEAIIEGRDIDVPPSLPIKNRSIFQFWKRP